MKSLTASGKVVAVAAALLFVALQAMSAQQAATPARPAQPPVPSVAAAVAQPAAEQAGREPAKAGGEGLKIHGHWKLDVHNPDGTFVKSIEFENSLITPSSADVVLSQMFAGQFALAGFSIFAVPNLSSTLCPASLYTGDCGMIPSYIGINSLISWNECAYAVCTQNLTQTYVPYNLSTNSAAYFQLQGSFSPTADGLVFVVKTVIAGCESSTGGISTVTNQQCSSSTAAGIPSGSTFEQYTFTSAVLPTPLSLVAGQVVTVTVTISFS